MTQRQQNLFSGPLDSGAEFSPCRVWRYALWRVWAPDEPYLAVIGLNPSTADEIQDDPTIRRCIGFAKRWGFGGYFMLNAFGYRATDPKVMKAAADPVGPGNDEAIRRITGGAGQVVAAWGNHCPLDREQAVCRLIRQSVYCLGTTRSGRPKHPLYLPNETKPELFFQEKGKNYEKHDD